MFNKIVLAHNSILEILDREFKDYSINKRSWRNSIILHIEWGGGDEEVEHFIDFEAKTMAEVLNKFNKWYEEKYKEN